MYIVLVLFAHICLGADGDMQIKIHTREPIHFQRFAYTITSCIRFQSSNLIKCPL